MKSILTGILFFMSSIAFANELEFSKLEALVDKTPTKVCLCDSNKSYTNYVGYVSYEKDITFDDSEKKLIYVISATCKRVSEENKLVRKCYEFKVIDSI